MIFLVPECQPFHRCVILGKAGVCYYVNVLSSWSHVPFAQLRFLTDFMQGLSKTLTIFLIDTTLLPINRRPLVSTLIFAYSGLRQHCVELNARNTEVYKNGTPYTRHAGAQNTNLRDRLTRPWACSQVSGRSDILKLTCVEAAVTPVEALVCPASSEKK